MIISCYARGEGTPYDGLYREAPPEIRRGTQQIFVRGGSAPRFNPLPVEKAFYVCDWFLFYDSASFQQLKGIQSSKHDMWKDYHLSIEGIQNHEKWYIKGIRGGPSPYKNLLSTPNLPPPPPPPLPGCYVSMMLGPAHKCCFTVFEFSRIVRSSDLSCTR